MLFVPFVVQLDFEWPRIGSPAVTIVTVGIIRNACPVRNASPTRKLCHNRTFFLTGRFSQAKFPMVISIAGQLRESITRALWENLTVAKILKDTKNDRRTSADRREGSDRRKSSKPVNVERRATERRKVPRRRQIDPTTCERDYSGEEIEFMQALDAYKRANGRMFPTCSEILEVIRALGYVRINTGALTVTPIGDGQTTDEANTISSESVSNDEQTGGLTENA